MVTTIELPGLDCGLCGYRTCEEFRGHLASSPESIRRCIHLSEDSVRPETFNETCKALIRRWRKKGTVDICRGGSKAASHKRRRLLLLSGVQHRAAAAAPGASPTRPRTNMEQAPWHDNLGREFDFYLEHFPEDPGPRRSSFRTIRPSRGRWTFGWATFSSAGRWGCRAAVRSRIAASPSTSTCAPA